MNKLFRWGLLSVSSFALVLGVTALAHALGANERTAFAIALITSFATNFTACKFFVFRGNAGSAKSQGAQYAGLTLTSRAFEYAAFWLLLDVLHLHYLLVATVVMATASVAKFVACNTVIFRPTDAHP